MYTLAASHHITDRDVREQAAKRQIWILELSILWMPGLKSQ